MILMATRSNWRSPRTTNVVLMARSPLRSSSGKGAMLLDDAELRTAAADYLDATLRGQSPRREPGGWPSCSSCWFSGASAYPWGDRGGTKLAMSALADRPEAVDPLLFAQVAAMLRDPTKDKAIKPFPLGQEAAEFLRIKRKRLTPASERAYEAALAQLALYFPTLELRDLELPAGVGLLERFMDDIWGDSGATDLQQESFVRIGVLQVSGDPREDARQPVRPD